MSTPEIKQVEQELEGLQKDNTLLLELRNKYEKDFVEADNAWRKSRSQKDLDAMVRVKSQLDTVKSALIDQAVEISKTEAYLNTIREEHRLRLGITAVGTNQLLRLETIQSEFGQRLSALQQHVVNEAVALDALRVEWDELHREAWQQLAQLGLSPEQANKHLGNAELETAPLRLIVPPVDRELRRETEQAYTLPLRNTPGKDSRSQIESATATHLAFLLQGAELERVNEANRLEVIKRDARRAEARRRGGLE
ncbi:hypothetical protein [Deinococcus sp. Leaf326]|uniref:hypothetical protein n=1 Tax=Deinococcus sp. Leaf326 TaxID=1736338 RepID=UPI0006F74CE4|nr:hypothetical protein [Deinococcus sp. Leaf326]KQR27262.1 hypothetical protein ASF71_17725 [Deinococcus sp. Leaf326]